MGFKFSSFIAGAAENLTETLKEDEKQAAAAASFGVKALKENYDKVQADNRKLENEVSENIKVLRTFDKTATEAELFAAATNKTYMQMAVEAAKTNPASFKVNDVVRIKENNASNQTAMEMLKAYTDIPTVSKAARLVEGNVAPQKPEGLFGIGTLRNRAAASAGSKAEEQTAKAMGVSIEQLRAASGYKRPELDTGAEFDMAKFQKAKEFKELKDKAQVDLLTAQENGDPKAINAASERVARINTNESIGQVKNKTDAQIQSDLVTEIQEKQKSGDKQGAAFATALLRQRQALMKAQGDGKTDADKITQSNLIQVATRTRATTIEQKLPPGQLITTTDAQGNVTMSLRDLDQGDLFRQGDAIAANAIIKEMAKPDGTPRSEMHKNAMMSVGIRFDDAGKAIKPIVPELPTKGGKTTPSNIPAVAPPTRGGPTPAAPAPAAAKPTSPPAIPQLTETDKQALVWANNPANAGKKADAIKAAIEQKLKVNN